MIVGLQRPVADMTRSIDFYVRGLGFEVASSISASHTVLRLGSELVELVELAERGAMRTWTALVNGPDVRFQHAAIVAADMAAAYTRLMHLVPVCITNGGPQQLPAASGGVTAFKFRDPDGHPLELIAFAPGVGNARWQVAAEGAITLGIDHFALSVSDIERSIAFYRRRFGFKVASRQTNHGAQQARLDGLDISTVEVVALVPGTAATPHIELLGYRQPPPQISLDVLNETHEAQETITDCLLFDTIAFVTDCGGVAPTLLRDPDGHAFANVTTQPVRQGDLA